MRLDNLAALNTVRIGLLPEYEAACCHIEGPDIRRKLLYPCLRVEEKG
jgi:hypothetical protein